MLIRLVDVDKSEGDVGGGEGLRLAMLSVWLALVGQESYSALPSMKCRDYRPSTWNLLLVFLCL